MLAHKPLPLIRARMKRTAATPMKPTAATLRDILIIAAAYYLAGRIGLMFALPPGYASPVWPPAGIGLAAVMLRGWRCWPGIFLGSMLTNLTDGVMSGADLLTVGFWMLPTIIAFAAVMRALAGSWLARRFVHFPNALENPRDIALLMLLGGPVSCLISCTLSCAALLAAGVITPENFTLRWYAWWMGDIMGVVVFTPLLLLLFAEQGAVSRYRRTVVGACLLFLFALDVYAFWNISKHEDDTARFRFERKAEQLTQQLQEKIDQQLSLLVAAKSFIAMNDAITHDQFTRFIEPQLADNAFITGISWIPRVRQHERAAFERAMRAQGLQGFSIRTQNAQGELIAAPPREEYFPITYTLPPSVRRATDGFDIAGEPHRKKVIADARDSGEARMLTPISLLATGGGPGLIVYLPVYRESPLTPSERRVQLRGYVATGIAIPHLLKPLAEAAEAEHMQLSLLAEPTNESGEQMLFDSRPAANASLAGHSADRLEKSFLFAGNRLSLQFLRDPGFVTQQEHWVLWAALTGAALLMMLIGMLMLIVTGRIDTVQRLVEQKTEELRVSNERFQLVVDGTIDGIWDWPDSTRDEVYWSPQWKALLGYRDEEIQGSKSLLRELLHPDDRAACADAIRACLEEGGLFDIEYRLRKKSGEYGWFHGKGVVSKGADITRMTGSITDISERKFAELVRDRLVKQLISANEQLEQFAYVASHDLREPLRIVVSFSDLLAREYSERLNEEAREYLAIMRDAARKMEAMVADLLDYGRLGHDNERLSEIDSNRALMQTAEALAESIRATQAVIGSDPLPHVVANHLRFSRLLQNLIGNAIKYQRPGNPPVIHVSAEDKGTHWQFSVRDNGIGIKPEYLDSIFAPFKRLHSDHEYAGTGIGLAICQRIVEGFGGVIWAESTFGSGSTFFFTIPKRG